LRERLPDLDGRHVPASLVRPGPRDCGRGLIGARAARPGVDASEEMTVARRWKRLPGGKERMRRSHAIGTSRPSRPRCGSCLFRLSSTPPGGRWALVSDSRLGRPRFPRRCGMRGVLIAYDEHPVSPASTNAALARQLLFDACRSAVLVEALAEPARGRAARGRCPTRIGGVPRELALPGT